jgi:hypothetical protein
MRTECREARILRPLRTLAAVAATTAAVASPIEAAAAADKPNWFDGRGLDELGTTAPKKAAAGNAADASIVVPDVKLPDIKLPDVDLPSVDLKRLKLPSVPDLSKVPLDNIQLPNVSSSSIHAPQLPLSEQGRNALVGAGVATGLIGGGILAANKLFSRNGQRGEDVEFIQEEEEEEEEVAVPEDEPGSTFSFPNIFARKDETPIPPPVPVPPPPPSPEKSLFSFSNPFGSKPVVEESSPPPPIPNVDEGSSMDKKKSPLSLPDLSIPNPLDAIRSGAIANRFRSGATASLTEDLMALAFATNQGQDASSRQMEAALDMVAKLERLAGPVPAKKLFSRQMDGTWELEFCSDPYLFRANPFFMARRSSCSSDCFCSHSSASCCKNNLCNVCPFPPSF